MNEKEVAEKLGVSLAAIRRWRLKAGVLRWVVTMGSRDLRGFSELDRTGKELAIV
jgi:predicted site-specific integrase-resolvase